MKILKSVFALFFFSVLFSVQLEAQNPTISFEEVKKLCSEDIPREDRIRVSVVRFSSRMRSPHNELGNELATMLTNALYEMHCFRVLESASNMGDFDQEFDIASKGYTNSSAPQKGKMLGSQAIITGEITEYAQGSKNIAFSGLKVGSEKAHVGFILKVLHPETREVLFSKSVNMEGKASGFSGLRAGGFHIAGSEDRSRALNDAVEKAIIKAAEILTKSKSSWGISTNDGVSAGNKGSVTLFVDGIQFSHLVQLNNKVQALATEGEINKSFANNQGVFAIPCDASADELAMKLLEKLGNGYEFKEVNKSANRIVLQKI